MANLCDWGHETNTEIRKLPFGDNNILCCKLHYHREVNFRRLRNAELKENFFPLPKWEDLEIYSYDLDEERKAFERASKWSLSKERTWR